MSNVIARYLCYFAAALVMSACAKEDMSGCTFTCTFTVKAYGENNAELTSDVVSDVILYVFDKDRLFVKEIDAKIGDKVSIDYPEGDEMHVVGWGNLKGNAQERGVINVGEHISSCSNISLKPTTRAHEVCDSPDDLFSGSITALRNISERELVLPIYRKTGSMNITLLKLQDAAGFYDNDYSIVVRETFNQFDISGNVTGNRTAAYRPTAAFVYNPGLVQTVYYVHDFKLLPDDTGVVIDIYHGSTLFTTISSCNGLPITIEEGKLTNVLIDFTGSVSVHISMTPWGEKQIWKIY